MAENDSIGSITDEEMENEAVVKTEKRVSFLPKLLKWIAIVVATVIFIVAVVIVTVNIMNKRGKGLSEYPTSPEYRDNREIPEWYSAIGRIQTMTADPIPASVVAEIKLAYSESDKTTPQELSGRLIEIKDFLRSYFRNKTAKELENEENIKIELRNLINDNILSRGKVVKVAILQLDVIQQD